MTVCASSWTISAPDHTACDGVDPGTCAVQCSSSSPSPLPPVHVPCCRRVQAWSAWRHLDAQPVGYAAGYLCGMGRVAASCAHFTVCRACAWMLHAAALSAAARCICMAAVCTCKQGWHKFEWALAQSLQCTVWSPAASGWHAGAPLGFTSVKSGCRHMTSCMMQPAAGPPSAGTIRLIW